MSLKGDGADDLGFSVFPLMIGLSALNSGHSTASFELRNGNAGSYDSSRRKPCWNSVSVLRQVLHDPIAHLLALLEAYVASEAEMDADPHA